MATAKQILKAWKALLLTCRVIEASLQVETEAVTEAASASTTNRSISEGQTDCSVGPRTTKWKILDGCRFSVSFVLARFAGTVLILLWTTLTVQVLLPRFSVMTVAMAGPRWMFVSGRVKKTKKTRIRKGAPWTILIKVWMTVRLTWPPLCRMVIFVMLTISVSVTFVRVRLTAVVALCISLG